MFVFFGKFLHKTYYTIVIFILSYRQRYEWKKALCSKKNRKNVRVLAYYFRRSELLKKRIELAQIKRKFSFREDR
ncbi:hypothetical protein CL629_02005 [bacterium]|nr:hypothetical protein [bacterium]